MPILSRRAALKVLVTGPLGLVTGLTASQTFGANASWPKLQIGDVLLTRNAAWGNPIPGWYNHAAIYDGTNVIEAQIGDNAVKRTPLNTFYNNYPIIDVYRHISVKLAPITTMGKHSTTLVGQKYVSIQGWFPKIFSCVSLIRVCYARGFAVDPGFNIPDHISGSGLFKMIGWK
jgi:cell wall-associated NlpC family hydrolase